MRREESKISPSRLPFTGHRKVDACEEGQRTPGTELGRENSQDPGLPFRGCPKVDMSDGPALLPYMPVSIAGSK